MISVNFIRTIIFVAVFGYCLLLSSVDIHSMEFRPLNQFSRIPQKVSNGAGILPYYYDEAGLVFVILGLEPERIDWKGNRCPECWDYFGGRQISLDQDALHTATRKFQEETYQLISQEDASDLWGYVIVGSMYTLFLAEVDRNHFVPELLFQYFLDNKRTRLLNEKKIDFVAIPFVDLINNTENGILPGLYVSASKRSFNGLSLCGGLLGYINRARHSGTDQQRVFQSIVNGKARIAVKKVENIALENQSRQEDLFQELETIEMVPVTQQTPEPVQPQQVEAKSGVSATKVAAVVGSSGLGAYFLYKIWKYLFIG